MTPLMSLIVALLATVAPPCPTEDSINCVWVGPEYGNHRGASFLDIDGTPYYLGEN